MGYCDVNCEFLLLAFTLLLLTSCGLQMPARVEESTQGSSTSETTVLPHATPLSENLIVLNDARQLPSRRRYRSFDFEHDPWLASFRQSYQAALENQAVWLEDPIVVALRLSGYPNPDGIQPTQVSVFYPHSAEAIVIILRDPLPGDDSVAAEENRIELVKNENLWEITWAGGRYRCQPGRGQQRWQPKLCV